MNKPGPQRGKTSALCCGMILLMVLFCWCTSPGSCRRVNVALGKPTQQTGIRFGGDSARAVDGLKDQGLCSHTDSTYPAWWQVDLLDDYFITGIEITNRNYGKRLANFTVEVSSVDPASLPGFPEATSSPICFTRLESVPSRAVMLLPCESPVTGRYVRLVKHARTNVPFGMCELEVYTPGHWRLERRVLDPSFLLDLLETVTGRQSLVGCGRSCVFRTGWRCSHIQFDRVDGVCRLLKSAKATGEGNPSNYTDWETFALLYDS